MAPSRHRLGELRCAPPPVGGHCWVAQAAQIWGLQGAVGVERAATRQLEMVRPASEPAAALALFLSFSCLLPAPAI
eukprot:353684-Chlamydomonas_euryale.AAC.8